MKIDISDAIVLIISYLIRKIKQQVHTILPMIAIMITFQFFIVKYPINESISTIFYLLLLIPATMFMLEGIKLALVPLVESVALRLVQNNHLFLFISSLFLFGVSIVIVEQYSEFKNMVSTSYILSLSLIVGMAMVYGMIRFLLDIKFKDAIYTLLVSILILSFIIYTIDETYLGMSLDSVNLIINPVIYSIILSFGYGVTRARRGGSTLDMYGFGTITLIALLSILFTQIYFFIIYFVGNSHLMIPPINVDKTIESIGSIEINVSIISIYILYILFLEFMIIKNSILNIRDTIIGILFVIIGTTIFFIGLKYGLSVIADNMFFLLPSITKQVDIVGEITIGYGPLYPQFIGRLIIVSFIFLLGYSATIAEPALSIIAKHTQKASTGAFRNTVYIHIVAVGVGIGSSLGALNVIYHLNYFALIAIPIIITILILPRLDTKIGAIAMDYASVGVGPITIIMVASLLRNFHIELDQYSSFLGILALCWLYGYISILIFSYIRGGK